MTKLILALCPLDPRVNATGFTHKSPSDSLRQRSAMTGKPEITAKIRQSADKTSAILSKDLIVYP